MLIKEIYWFFFYLFRIIGLSQSFLDRKQILFCTTLLKQIAGNLFVNNSFIIFPRRSKEHLEYLLLSLVSWIQTLNAHALVKSHTSFSSIMCIFPSRDLGKCGWWWPLSPSALPQLLQRQAKSQRNSRGDQRLSVGHPPPLAAITTSSKAKKGKKEEGEPWLLKPLMFLQCYTIRGRTNGKPDNVGSLSSL